MNSLKLFMILIGCKPNGRHTEQHDIFFCVGQSLKSIVPDINEFWPDAGTIHIDAWREVTEVDGNRINILPRTGQIGNIGDERLFFINLGGYKPDEFEEFHYKTLVVSKEKGAATRMARETTFYKHTGFKGAESHIDDRYGIDVDDIYEIRDILPRKIREKYCIQILPDAFAGKDKWHVGYTMLSKLI